MFSKNTFQLWSVFLLPEYGATNFAIYSGCFS